MPNTHGLLTPAELADQQELRQRVQERQEFNARQDAALRAYKDGPVFDHEPMVPLVAFVIVAVLCLVLIVALVL